MINGATWLRPNANRGGTSAGLTAILAVAAMGGGLYLVTHRSPPPPAPSSDAFTEVAALARVEQNTERLKRAIRERQAIPCMTYREVETAKGRPHFKKRDDALTETDRAKGGVENWVYNLEEGKIASVLFDVNGLVIYSSELGDTPGPGDVIRR